MSVGHERNWLESNTRTVATITNFKIKKIVKNIYKIIDFIFVAHSSPKMQINIDHFQKIMFHLKKDPTFPSLSFKSHSSTILLSQDYSRGSGIISQDLS